MNNIIQKNIHTLFYITLTILIVPNIALSVTEPISVMAKVCNIMVPFSLYYLYLSYTKNIGRAVWTMFPIIFLGAFQVVLLYLFGESVIAVDMFLNLTTTNTGEAMELLNNMLPAIITIVLMYVPTLIVAGVIWRKQITLKETTKKEEKKRSLLLLIVSAGMLIATYATQNNHQAKLHLFPVNVCYNIKLAIERHIKTINYKESSKEYSISAKSERASDEREIYVIVIGETSRAHNWQIYGYDRNTNPLLSKEEGLITFSKVLSESNTTHKSVPMLLSEVDAHSFNQIYTKKSIITAFKKAGFNTAFFSNQRYNNSFIDFFGKEADTYLFIKEEGGANGNNPMDTELVRLVEQEIEKGYNKQLIVLHTYGSHFNYRERYPKDKALFTPDYPVDASVVYKNNLHNAYDNSIAYTDFFLHSIIDLLKSKDATTALIYTSDHGEDIFDDGRKLFLHASPTPSYYQIHVPFLVWLSEKYSQIYNTVDISLKGNKDKDISSSSSLYHTALDIAGIQSSSLNISLSVANNKFSPTARVYLNDHNRAMKLKDINLKEEDYQMFKKKGISEK